MSVNVSLNFSDQISIKSGRQGQGRVEYFFLGLWRQFSVWPKAKMSLEADPASDYHFGNMIVWTGA
jgi:hypothetical protein